jgi:DNA invertase Pin-like site-specific DNA recombinase
MAELNPKIRRLGYARVSTYGQTLHAQLAQLRAKGCARIYREKASSAQPTRRELLRLLKPLGPGDVVTVTRIDRLTRSTFDLFAIVKQIVDAGAQFRSLAEPWADTTISTGRLMIAVLGGLADVERDLIRTRTAEGRSRAKARGHPPAETHATAA